MSRLSSWGRYPVVEQSMHPLLWQEDAFPDTTQTSLLAYGQGRSYGDVALNAGGTVMPTARLDRLLEFDADNGSLTCEAGVTLADILNLIVPRGWFLPVTPGTKFVSIAGAVANDVHGKNHHHAGSFGCYVQRLGLRRSDGSLLVCSDQENPELYHATIGGMGLTGLIVWVQIQLKKIPGDAIEQETLTFHNLEEFYALSADSAQDWEYTVAWVDCLARGRKLGRGIFFRGRHSVAPAKTMATHDYTRTRLSMPFNLPGMVLNKATVRMFNALYYHRPRQVKSRVHLEPFFYPLDKIAHWNRMYGRRGFFQFQCVIPEASAAATMTNMLRTIAASGQGSFLSVLKVFGARRSPGVMSFPRAGTTLALDFANRGAKTRRLLAQLDNLTVESGGAVYPAKDACMSAASFQQYYPQWREFSQWIDPAFSSSFWRRVTQQENRA